MPCPARRIEVAKRTSIFELEGTRQSTIPQSRQKVRFVCDDPTLTPAAGLALVAQVDRVLEVTGTLDALVPPVKRRRQGASVGQLLVALAECQLAGGDFFADLDGMRADQAGAVLRAVPASPSARTGLELAGRFGPAQWAGIVAANRVLVDRYWQALPDKSRRALRTTRPTIDIDPTDVAVYGAGKEGVGFTYQGVRAARPVPVCWAEAGLVLSATLLAGNNDVRPHAQRLIAQAVDALPEGTGRPRIRADSGLFSADVAWACVEAKADFAIAAPRNEAIWAAMREIPRSAWRPARDMTGAQVAVMNYAPAGFPPGSYTIVRRVKYSADDISADPRARRRRTIDPHQLPLALAGEITTCHAYSFIVTNLRGNPVRIEAWFRNRGQIEERIKDSKLGMALRHLPSGKIAANRTWMWACLLALNLSVWLQGLARLDADGRAHGKRLRRELIRVPGRLARHARTLTVHLHPDQWLGPLVDAYRILSALPAATGG